MAEYTFMFCRNGGQVYHGWVYYSFWYEWWWSFGQIIVCFILYCVVRYWPVKNAMVLVLVNCDVWYEWWWSFVQVWSSHLPTNRWMAALGVQLNTHPNPLIAGPFIAINLSQNLDYSSYYTICTTKCSSNPIYQMLLLSLYTQFVWKTHCYNCMLIDLERWLQCTVRKS